MNYDNLKGSSFPWIIATKLASEKGDSSNDWLEEVLKVAGCYTHWCTVIIAKGLSRKSLGEIAKIIEDRATKKWKLSPKSLAAGIIAHPVLLTTLIAYLDDSRKPKFDDWLLQAEIFLRKGRPVATYRVFYSRSFPLSKEFIKNLPKNLPEFLLRTDVSKQLDEGREVSQEYIKDNYNQQIKKYGYAGPWTSYARGIVALDEKNHGLAFDAFLAGIELIEGLLFGEIDVKEWEFYDDARKINTKERYALVWIYLLIRYELAPTYYAYGMLEEAKRGLLQAFTFLVDQQLLFTDGIMKDVQAAVNEYTRLALSDLPNWQMIDILTLPAATGKKHSQNMSQVGASIYQLCVHWEKNNLSDNRAQLQYLGKQILNNDSSLDDKLAIYYAGNIASVFDDFDLAKKLLDKFIAIPVETWFDRELRIYALELKMVLLATEKGLKYWDPLIDLLEEFLESSRVACLYMPEEEFLMWVNRSYPIYSSMLTLLLPNGKRSTDEESQTTEIIALSIASLQALAKTNIQLRQMLTTEDQDLAKVHRRRVKLSSALAKYDFQVEGKVKIDLGKRIMADRRGIMDLIISNGIRRINVKKLGEINPEMLKATLKGRSLLYFIKYLVRNPFVSGGYEAEKYGVFVMTPNQKGMAYHELGLAADIEQPIQQVMDRINEGSEHWKQPANKAYEILLQPIEDLLKQSDDWVICPAGQIGQLPFEVLPFNEKLLTDHVSISYVDAIWDLMSDTEVEGGPKSDVVLGDPNFNHYQPANETLGLPAHLLNYDEIEKKKAGKILPLEYFTRIGETANESTEIGKILHVKPWLYNDAKESKIKSVTSPRILHLATHGFYIGGASDKQQLFVDFFTTAFRGSEYTHPLLRSGIALAGANWYVDSHESTDSEDDGILNGYDALELDLKGTELVVLSACRTGINETLGISGALGLRFSLSAAGASALLTTLWPVYDTTTRDFMVAFYKHLSKGKDKSDALRQAKNYIRNHKDYGEHPFYWAGFMLYGNQDPITQID